MVSELEAKACDPLPMVKRWRLAFPAMAQTEQLHSLEEAFDRIEETILPSLSLMLDSLIESASLARPGIDAASYAAELSTLAVQLEELTREVEEASPARIVPQPFAASAA
jgi:hypothetical protein